MFKLPLGWLIAGGVATVAAVALVLSRSGSNGGGGGGNGEIASIVDSNGVHWTHYIDEDGDHVAEELEIYPQVYGIGPKVVRDTHAEVMAGIVEYASTHELPTSII